MYSCILYIYLACSFLYMFISNKRQNGFTDQAQGSSREGRNKKGVFATNSDFLIIFLKNDCFAMNTTTKKRETKRRFQKRLFKKNRFLKTVVFIKFVVSLTIVNKEPSLR